MSQDKYKKFTLDRLVIKLRNYKIKEKSPSSISNKKTIRRELLAIKRMIRIRKRLRS